MYYDVTNYYFEIDDADVSTGNGTSDHRFHEHEANFL
ncbi:MAG: hypothetical protein BWX81_01209 [Spirochaetes bacterium ADurb.Bin110]|nr:MAG: hypothetical protein BWX81_01209 [Spirochaetes bacterium ADurb.Bin110]